MADQWYCCFLAQPAAAITLAPAVATAAAVSSHSDAAANQHEAEKQEEEGDVEQDAVVVLGQAGRRSRRWVRAECP